MALDGKMTPIEPGIIAQVAAGIRYTFTGQAPSWFGPMQPLAPLVPDNERDSVAGRQFDYPVGFNTRINPRDSEPVSFSQMRALADGYDILRLVIETRKDQMSKLKWQVKPRDEDKEADSRCQTITDFFALPDKFNTWDSWLRMLLEDLFVIDAPTLYVRPTVGGQVYSFEPVDGSTIKRVIDEHGRTPPPPDPAYQQILKGVPAINYTTDELIYRPRNVRTHKLYGYSPVEQIIMTVNIAMRRQIHQLQYYTEGSTPDLIFSVPATWNTDQISKFKTWWDSVLTGNTGNRRGTMFVPDGAEPKDTKEKALKDDYDEWLARVICFAFSISPTPFIKQQNRATADNATEQASAEGLAPVQNWVKGLMDYIIINHFKAPDLEFSWSEEEAVDPLVQAQINEIYIRSKVFPPDEVRADLGREPLTAEQREAAWPTPVMGDSANEQGNTGAGDSAAAAGGSGNAAGSDDDVSGSATGKSYRLIKRKKKVSPIDRNRKAVEDAQAAFSKACNKVFPKVAKSVAKQLGEMLNKVEAVEVDRILNAIDVSGLAVLSDDFEGIYEELVKDGAAVALAQIGIADDDRIVNLVNNRAVEWAKNRSAEMVGMRRLPMGLTIENPDAEWRIDESTRQMLRSTVTDAIEEGWSNTKLADEIQASYPFSDERAQMIARTETAFADVQGNMIAYRVSGLVQKKEWLTAPDSCDECQELDGMIVGIDEPFADGIDEPPYHPNCRCDVLPVIEEDTTEESE